MRRRVVAALASSFFLACACAVQPGPASDSCSLNDEESAWLDAWVAAWEQTHREILGVPELSPPPKMVFFNEACAFRGEGDGRWPGEQFDAEVALPDGSTIAPQVTSFASSYDDDTRVFFTMALPSIWRAGGIESSELGLGRLMTGVLLHEMSHAYQFADYIPSIIAADQRHGLGDALSDDIVQDTFQDSEEYQAAFAAERDLLFQAAAAPSEAQARRLAAEAMGMIRDRRGRYLTGKHEMLLELEDIFLTMEGVGQWVSYAWLSSEDGGGVPPELALRGVRRGAEKWSQDEGLAIYLVVDRLLPDWKVRAFGKPSETALEALERASGG